MSGIEPEIFKEKDVKCYKKGCNLDNKCSYCFVNAKKSIYSRKCFMTGEYCSKQTSIQRERKDLHEKDEINAFVIMSFSDMADVVYEQRIKRFIKKLKNHLAFDENRDRICCSKKIVEEETYDEKDKYKILNNIKYRKVKKIHVERGDTDVASNYVMCSRICQRIQIADLIVVDVSHQNPNVFYELGMAIALGKMILPICFSESYYKMSVPELVKETEDEYKIIEHHIGSYPWRKDLFEYYGIFQKKSEIGFEEKDEGAKNTHYMEYNKATEVKFGFSDKQYKRFPYDADLLIERENGSKDNKVKVGEKLYNELRNSYNLATKKDNTLLVYTMDGFLNEDEAGICIVNFYHTITSKLQENLCFCGDRVGVLVQGNAIPEEDKDSSEQIDLFYSIGEIIHLGVNQATYLSEEEKLKTDDVIASRNVDTWKKEDTNNNKITEKQRDGVLRAIKGYIRNRGMIIYPDNPVYVKRELDKFAYTEAKMVLEDECILEKIKKLRKEEICHCTSNQIKCLYHKTLQSLRYVNEVVIDISDNSIQSLFWLGVAHGSSVNAIIVSHHATEKEREKITGGKDKKVRTVFDVAGLWTAILHSNDTQGFYRQLAQAQYGIVNHEKLMLKDKSVHEKKLHDTWITLGEKFEQNSLETIYGIEKNEIKQKLESYYRSRFWTAMLRHNQLLICMPQIEESKNSEKEPRGFTSKWDFRASALLSHYLSKRTVISEYRIEALDGKKPVKDIQDNNFISLGSEAKPLGKTLSQYILENGKLNGMIHEHDKQSFHCKNNEKTELRVYKGFEEISLENELLQHKKVGYYTQHPHFNCANKQIMCFEDFVCSQEDMKSCRISDLQTCDCKIYGTNEHKEIAQLIMWRESSNNFHEKTVFRVAINGSSGPATLALASILVGDDQKIELFHAKTEEEKNKFKYDKNLLNKLQADIRKQFMNRYKDVLFNEMEIILKNEDKDNKETYQPEQRTRYEELVWYAVSTYFYNELYRYFLPLLSDKDIYSLYNGMYNFINHMRIDKESPFDVNYPQDGDITYPTAIKKNHVIQIIEQIPETLWLLLSEFRGLEVFFEVKVKHDLIQNVFKNETTEQDNTEQNPTNEEKKEDTRDVLDIMLLKESINCFGINAQ